jgi:hypothetical protein
MSIEARIKRIERIERIGTPETKEIPVVSYKPEERARWHAQGLPIPILNGLSTKDLDK